MLKEDVLQAEIYWTLKIIVSHYSFNSSQETSELFMRMFPDSEIAKGFCCGERKVAYTCVFSLAEYFHKILKENVKEPFVVLFDESLNKKMQEK